MIALNRKPGTDGHVAVTYVSNVTLNFADKMKTT